MFEGIRIRESPSNRTLYHTESHLIRTYFVKDLIIFPTGVTLLINGNRKEGTLTGLFRSPKGSTGNLRRQQNRPTNRRPIASGDRTTRSSVS